ncbi:TPA: hypothetical protein NID39_002324 [Pseudomonas aeruginosa]|uniref:hypothetical protein n=1 Tax=Pseudomonas aeruginosa TaxID=287 RepID=UPI00066A6765|nr:hypothetical protein [Pseudomonas aeruginosa]MBG3963835.1 hypothetical protein [Pseudomonas aeruginosa]MBG6934540.1 hypothetical protein [Pseudomonas aeruginosa]MBG6943756.1 hypothetical protein [Pseudomonas aeruginosa]MBG7348493.1 hypothetical protein [Pseudomonas aeruginosa]MBG7352870.1 hypothetical protein [Pseudomonas aeruginosa]
MAFSYPIAIHFPSLPRAALEEKALAVVAALRRRHAVVAQVRESVSELVVDPATGEWLDTRSVATDCASLEQCLQRYDWLRLEVELRLGQGRYFAALCSFPVDAQAERGGLQFNFSDRAYPAIHEFEDGSGGQFDGQVKRDFLAVCMTVVRHVDADAFILLQDEGRFRCIELDEVLQRLVEPEMSLHGRRPGSITGVRSAWLSAQRMRELWALPHDDPRCFEAGGYSVLDMIQRFAWKG